MIESYSLGDDNRFNKRMWPENPNVIDNSRPLNHAVAPGAPDGDPKGFHFIQRPNTVSGEVGND